jgi:3-isopropylmalate dehydrogenase
MGRSILVLPGDGIGPEVTRQAVRVLSAVAERQQQSWEIQEAAIGGAAIDAANHPFPDATRALVERADAILLGAVGGPQWAEAAATPEQGLLALRASLGLFANIRPFEVLPGLEAVTPLKKSRFAGVIIRELLGGLYYGTPRGIQGDRAVDTSIYTVDEILRIARIGFEMARQQGVALVSVDKANVLDTSKLWRAAVSALGAREYPDVSLEHRYVDAAAMEMVLAPERYRVVVTENLFGDILSDLSGGLVGSLGVLGSATVGGWTGGKGLYEPVHGSAPDIAGQGIANPMGAVWSVSLMLEWSFGLHEVAELIREAVRDTAGRGIRTPDLGGTAGTDDVVDAILERMNNLWSALPAGR